MTAKTATANAAALYAGTVATLEAAAEALTGTAARLATWAAHYAAHHDQTPREAVALQVEQARAEALDMLKDGAERAARCTATPDAAAAAYFVARLARENADDLAAVDITDAAHEEADGLTPVYNRDLLEAWDGSDPDGLTDLRDLGGIWGAIRYRVYEQHREGLEATAEAWAEYVDTLADLEAAADALAEFLAENE